MQNITVYKADLTEILTENKTKHRSVFEQAQEIYRARVIEELDRRLADARAGRKVDLFFRLPTPEDHTSDYDRVLRMLELEIGVEIELTEQDVKMYVQDDWAWAASFASNTTAYLED